MKATAQREPAAGLGTAQTLVISALRAHHSDREGTERHKCALSTPRLCFSLHRRSHLAVNLGGFYENVSAIGGYRPSTFNVKVAIVGQAHIKSD